MSATIETGNMTMADAVARWAGRYGLKIFPCHWIENGVCSCGDAGCTRPGKHPLTANGYHDAVSDPEQIAEWWANWPLANIGMPCRMNDRVVVDIDPRNGGLDGIAALEAAYGPVQSPWTYATGSGGEHRHFIDPGGPLHTKLRQFPGVDFKSDGYVILPPSSHVSGRAYQLTDASNLNLPVPAMPDTLRAVLVKPAVKPPAPAATARGTAGDDDTAGDDTVQRAARLIAPFWPKNGSGDRDNFVGALAGALGRRYDDDLVLSVIETAASIAAEEDEVAKRMQYAERTLAKLRAGGEQEVTGWPTAFTVGQPGLEDVRPTVEQLLDARAPINVVDPAMFSEAGGGTDLKFPETAYIGLGREFADLYSQYFEAPREFWYSAFLTFLGTYLSKKVFLAKEPTRLYTALLGTSGWTRKSTAMDETEDFFLRVQGVYFPQDADGLKAAGAPVVLHGSGSAEAIAKVIQAQQARPFLLKFDELKALLDKGRQDGSQLMPLLTNTWGKGRWSNQTLTYGVSLTEASISILAACTLKTFESAFRGSEADIGFLNRLWLVPGQIDKLIDVPLSPPEEEVRRLVGKVGTRIRELTAIGDRLTKVEFAPDARGFWTAWYTNFRQQVATAETAARVDSYGLRLCLTLAACEEGSTVLPGTLIVSPAVVQAVIAMLEWQVRVRAFYYPTLADTPAAAMEQKILKVLRRVAGQWVRRSDLYKLVNATRAGARAFDGGIDALLKNSAIKTRTEQNPRNGTTARFYRYVVEEA